MSAAACGVEAALESMLKVPPDWNIWPAPRSPMVTTWLVREASLVRE